MRLLLALCLATLAGFAAAQVPLPPIPTWMSIETDFNGTGLDVGDVDRNGWLDLAVSNGNDITASPNFVYLNQEGVLPTQASWVSADHRYSGHCQLADLDHDGYPELMVANYITAGWGPAQVQVYDNVDGVLAASPTWESPADFHTFRAAFGDPDQDGDLDLAVATGEAYNGYYEQNRIYFNQGGVLATAPGWTSTVADASYDIKFVDYDGDGDQDLACLGGGWTGRVRIYVNEGGVLGTTAGWTSAANDNGNSFDFADLDQDGRLDLVVGFNTQIGGSGRCAAFLTAGGALPTTPTWTSNFRGYGSAVVCCDLDRQNGPDIVAGGWWEPVRVYLNDGTGGFAGDPEWQTDEAWASVVENICFADLDEGRSRLETVEFAAGSRLLTLPHRHLQDLAEVTVGGSVLPATAWCASLRDGWVSLAQPAAGVVAVTYRVSDAPDLAISNWDQATFVFANLLPTAAPDTPPVAAITGLRAWPNPFNPSTEIVFALGADAAAARVDLYDVRGRRVETLHAGPLSAGAHRFVWQPRGLASGVYLYRGAAAGMVASGKVVLAK